MKLDIVLFNLLQNDSFGLNQTVHILMGESNTVVSAYTMYRHLQQYYSHPLICRMINELFAKIFPMIFLHDRVENIVRKGEKAGYLHFLLFPQYFLKPSALRLFKL